MIQGFQGQGEPTYEDAERAYKAFCGELARVRERGVSPDRPDVQPAWEFLSVPEKAAWLKACEAVDA